MTPEQRAAMETAFSKESEKGPQTETERECITKQEAEQPFDVGETKDCTQTVVRTTRTTQEVRLVLQRRAQGHRRAARDDADAGNDDRLRSTCNSATARTR